VWPICHINYKVLGLTNGRQPATSEMKKKATHTRGRSVVRSNCMWQSPPSYKKVQLSLCIIKHHSMKPHGGVKVLCAFLTLALDRSERSPSCWMCFTTGKGSSCPDWIEGWVGHRVGFDASDRREILLLPGIKTWFLDHPSHSVVATPTHFSKYS